MALTLTMLGSGTSTGVPIPTCRCAICRSKNPKNKRLRASAWIKSRGKSILIDTSTDLRQQALTQKIGRIDAVLYTHPHTDHIHGIDELRCYNFSQKAPIPLYGNAWTGDELRNRFGYIFSPGPIEGGGIPELTFEEFNPSLYSADNPLNIQGISVIPLPLSHGSKESVGYRIDTIAYVTDCSYIPDSSLNRMQGLSVLILDCVRLKPHRTHLNLDGALEIISKVRPGKTYLTHLGHEFDYAKWSKKLPKGVHLAYDGLKITVKSHQEKGPYDRRRSKGNQK